MRQLKAEGDGRETISHDKWLEIIVCAKNDKTLTAFFEEGVTAAPIGLREFWRSNIELGVVRDKVIPMFRVRAQFLTE